jgi:hypothetical protein
MHQSTTTCGKTWHGWLTQQNRTLWCQCSRTLLSCVYVPVCWHWLNTYLLWKMLSFCVMLLRKRPSKSSQAQEWHIHCCSEKKNNNTNGSLKVCNKGWCIKKYCVRNCPLPQAYLHNVRKRWVQKVWFRYRTMCNAMFFSKFASIHPPRELKYDNKQQGAGVAIWPCYKITFICRLRSKLLPSSKMVHPHISVMLCDSSYTLSFEVS